MFSIHPSVSFTATKIFPIHRNLAGDGPMDAINGEIFRRFSGSSLRAQLQAGGRYDGEPTASGVMGGGDSWSQLPPPLGDRKQLCPLLHPSLCSSLQLCQAQCHIGRILDILIYSAWNRLILDTLLAGIRI